jgi:hypothetical protein
MSKVDVDKTNGRFLSCCLVSGCPACSYIDDDGNLKFARCSTEDGYGTWESVVVENNKDQQTVIAFTSLLIVRGAPAIAFQMNNKLYYVRSSDKCGRYWDSPISVIDNKKIDKKERTNTNTNSSTTTIIMNKDFTTISENDSISSSFSKDEDIRGSHCCLKNIGGNPTIVYLNETANRIEYVQSRDCVGDFWNQPWNFDCTGTHLNLCFLNGYPVIIYYNYCICVLKSNTHTGLEESCIQKSKTWNTPIKLTYGGLNLSAIVNENKIVISYFEPPELGKISYKLHVLTFSDSPRYHSYCKSRVIGEDISNGPISIQISNDKPCVIFRHSGDSSLYSVKLWNDENILDNTTNIGDYVSTLKLAFGKIGVFYIDYTEGCIKYIETN